MNIESPKKKKSLVAKNISRFNSFLFWFGKKVYSFLLGFIFIIFIGSGVYAFFVGGESISAPSFEKDVMEDIKKYKMKENKEQKEYDKLSQEEKDKQIAIRMKAAEAIKSQKSNLEKKYEKDIKSFRRKHGQNICFGSSCNIEALKLITPELRDEWFYGYIDYIDEGYEYFSQDDAFDIFRHENNWERYSQIRPTLSSDYNRKFNSIVEDTHKKNSSSEATRMFALYVMGGSFIAFLIAVLIMIFIQIEANTRLENYISAKSMKK
jgi:hypothetical protein